MIEALLYLLSVLAAVVIPLVVSGPFVPDLALGFSLPLILFGRIKEALIVVILVILSYSMFSDTALSGVIAVHAIWISLLIFVQRFLNSAWLTQGVLAAVFLGALQYIFWAQANFDAALAILIHTGMNALWFVAILALADNQRWNETLFE